MEGIISKYFSSIIYVCIALIVFQGVISFSTFELSFPFFCHSLSRIKKISNFILIFLFIYQSLFVCFDKRKIAIFLVLIFFVAFCKKTWLIFDLFFISLLLSDFVSLKKAYKTILYTVLFSVFLILLFNYLSYIPTKDYYRFNHQYRYTFGFSHPNALGYIVITICFLLVTLYNRLNTIILLVFLSIAASFVYLVPNSNTSTIIIILLLLSVLFVRLSERYNILNNKKLLFYVSVLFIVLVIASIYYLSINSFGSTHLSDKNLGTFFSRFNLAKVALNEYGLSILGQKVINYAGNDPTHNYFVIDSAIIYLPIVVGLIPTIFYLVAFIYALKKNLEKNNLMLYCIQMILVIYAISENYIITSCLSMFVFLYPFKKNDFEK